MHIAFDFQAALWLRDGTRNEILISWKWFNVQSVQPLVFHFKPCEVAWLRNLAKLIESGKANHNKHCLD